jgi:hypothetical protein
MAKENIELTLKGVRLSFLNVFAPQEFTDENTGTVRYTYNTNILIPKKLPDGGKNPMVAELNAALKKAIDTTWPGGDKKIPSERRCLRDGEPIDEDTKDPDVPGSGTRYPLYDGYAGHYFISANRPHKTKAGKDNPPQLLGPRKTARREDGTPCFPRLKESDGLLYSGCFADVIIRIYGYDGKKDDNPDRVNANLEAIKFVRHGEAFGAKPVDADKAFDEEEGDDEFDGRAVDDDDIG